MRAASYLPNKCVDNFYFEKILDTSDSWISSRTGIKNRYFVEDEGIFDLAYKSVDNLFLTEEEKNSIKTIIVTSSTSNYSIPNLASQLQEKFNLSQEIYSLDINMACSGFVAGLRLIDGIIKKGERALMLGVEIFSDIIDFDDRNTAVLFGDGSGAALIEYSHEDSKYLSGTIGNSSVLKFKNKEKQLHMEGREVYRFGVNTLGKAIKSFLEEEGIDKDEIDYFICHQANIRILESLAKGLNVSMDKFPSNIDRVGNISSASIPVLLADMDKEGILNKGERILLVGFGAGLTWSLAHIKW